MAQPVVRLTANVSPAVADLLDSLAERLGTSKTEALNQAIVTAATLYDEAEGGQVIIKKGNTQREVNLSTNR
jgi:predicted transcriptional regulator